MSMSFDQQNRHDAGNCAIASKMTATSAAGTPAAGSSSRGSWVRAPAQMLVPPSAESHGSNSTGGARPADTAWRDPDTRHPHVLAWRGSATHDRRCRCSPTASATFSSTVSRRNRLVIWNVLRCLPLPGPLRPWCHIAPGNENRRCQARDVPDKVDRAMLTCPVGTDQRAAGLPQLEADVA